MCLSTEMASVTTVILYCRLHGGCHDSKGQMRLLYNRSTSSTFCKR